MQPSDAPASASRHATYYLDEGDIVVRADNALFRFHSFHLQRDSSYFDGAITNLGASSGEGAAGCTDENPLALDDVKAQDFANLLWFFYESAYKWSGAVDPSHTPRWESILTLAEKFRMRRIAKVACYALDRASALGDVRKVTLGVKHGMGLSWAAAELQRLLLRVEPMTIEETTQIGDLGMVTAIAAARESLRVLPPLQYEPCSAPVCSECSYHATCQTNGVHRCHHYSSHFTPCPDYYVLAIKEKLPMAEAVVQSVGLQLQLSAPSDLMRPELTPTPIRGDLFLKVENSVVSVHSYHLKRASHVFVDMFDLPSHVHSPDGAEDQPILLANVTRNAFQGLLWFLYDSPYCWTYVADTTMTTRWEEILAIADMFGMEEVCRVATYALDHNGGLPDIRKISLSVRHGIEEAWAFEAIKRVCQREEPLNKEEARALGLDMVTGIAAAREVLGKKSRAPKIKTVPLSSATVDAVIRDTVL